MLSITENSLDELVRAGSLLSRDMNFKSLISVLVEQALDITQSDLACLYLYSDSDDKKSFLKLVYKRGKYELPYTIEPDSEFIDFIRDCREAVVLLEKKESPFSNLLMCPQMESGIALPLTTAQTILGILFLNSRAPNFYNRKKFSFLDSFTKLAGGMLHNSILMQELKDYLKEIEEMKLYQENIFSSMTNLLITTDSEGKIRYFNTAAEEGFSISQTDIGKDFHTSFKKTIDKTITNTIDKTRKDQTALLGIEGIYSNAGRDMDFSLNISPLVGKRNKYQGITLLFTNQTKERELQEKMSKVVEDKRIIKNMFSRYLSKAIVKKLMETPHLVRPGGDKKEATILFADIRGYTSFSEGKDPAFIIDVLNEFFETAVEIVINHKGYIDKFIGDCIMATWGVPLQTEKEDAIDAVLCALEIQKEVMAESRNFFKGEASSLSVGIGMHSGGLVAGNLGSRRRLNYTVIGDTVNIAARLEGIAKSGDVIITQKTREYLDDMFVFEKRKPVIVKGKKDPIPIYNVLEKIN